MTREVEKAIRLFVVYAVYSMYLNFHLRSEKCWLMKGKTADVTKILQPCSCIMKSFNLSPVVSLNGRSTNEQ
jgi:hypothetical protein